MNSGGTRYSNANRSTRPTARTVPTMARSGWAASQPLARVQPRALAGGEVGSRGGVAGRRSAAGGVSTGRTAIWLTSRDYRYERRSRTHQAAVLRGDLSALTLVDRTWRAGPRPNLVA